MGTFIGEPAVCETGHIPGRELKGDKRSRICGLRMGYVASGSSVIILHYVVSNENMPSSRALKVLAVVTYCLARMVEPRGDISKRAPAGMDQQVWA